MMGLEPTTFCMASRRSSQLSYIRVRGDSSPWPARGRSPRAREAPSTPHAVEGLVDEAVGKLVVLTGYVDVLHPAELAGKTGRLERQRPQGRALDAVLAAHLLHEELGVRADLDL